MAEQLERRELLAANLFCPVETSPDAPQGGAVLVQSQPSNVAAGVETPLNQRERTDENSEIGVGRQKRPRDRDAEDAAATLEATLVTSDPITAVQAAGQGSAQQGGQALPSQDLTDTEIEHLIFIREEEKLARDVYLALAEQWNAPIFSNIAESEQEHMDAVGQLIVKYGLDDPITDDTPGVFNDETLQGLYDDLVARGRESLMEAYKVGAFIEEYDIIDIEDAIAETSHSDIENVYENLVRGSRNHLRSFVGQIEAAGETYVPVLLTISDFDAIMEDDLETANGRRSGGTSGQTSGHNSEPTVAATDRLFAGLGRRSGRRR
jgi:hypothetical protein